jgi:WD40 repeat protein
LLYASNSSSFDANAGELTLVDRRNRRYIFSVADFSVQYIRQVADNNRPRTLQGSDGYQMIPLGLLQTNVNPVRKVIQLDSDEYASTFQDCQTDKVVALGTQDGLLYLHDLKTDTTSVQQYQLPGTSVLDIAIDADGEFIATGGTDSRLRLNSIRLFKDRLPMELDFKSWVMAVKFISDKRLLVGTEKGDIYMLDYDMDRLNDLVCNEIRVLRTFSKYGKNRQLMDSVNNLKCRSKLQF